MSIIDERLFEMAKDIDEILLSVSNDNRKKVSKEILLKLRSFCELCMYKIYNYDNNDELSQTQENLEEIVRPYIGKKYEDLNRFHKLLDASFGHIAYMAHESEDLMIKYWYHLVELKCLMKDKFNIVLLENLIKYPLDLDQSIIGLYKVIIPEMKKAQFYRPNQTKNIYYIKKRSMKYVSGSIVYEYVFDISDDNKNKYNTFVGYSFKKIRYNYDLRLHIVKRSVSYQNIDMNINVILDYDYSIRPCSFKNLLYLLNYDMGSFERNGLYFKIMDTIKGKNVSLLDIIIDDSIIKLNSEKYSDFIEKVREFLNRDCMGKNTIKYLLMEMRNITIKSQHYKPRLKYPVNEGFNKLRINQGTRDFELMPIAYKPINTEPSLDTLSDVFNLFDNRDQLLYRNLESYINDNNRLFIMPADIGYSNEYFIEQMNEYNKKLDSLQIYNKNKIISVFNYFTIDTIYNKTKQIIRCASELCNKKLIELNNNYDNNTFLSDEKKDILRKCFTKNSIALVKGSAGTGKTALIKEFIKNNSDKKILCLTVTNTANDNLKVKTINSNICYKNITEFEYNDFSFKYDVIIIDEASFVDTSSMYDVFIRNGSTNYLIVGDTEQIESIKYGKWFEFLLHFLKKYNAVYELKKMYRTDVENIRKLWKEVREGKTGKILEMLKPTRMTTDLYDKEMLTLNDKEIVLCLNYDGLYGINSINRYLQSKNPADSYEYQQNYYKVNDPVVFITNDYKIYGIYNNLKGKIVEIRDEEKYIYFTIELDEKLNNFGRISDEISVTHEGEKSLVKVSKFKYDVSQYDNDMDKRAKLPFQVSYALSIHKAQGLEYDSVKIIITKESGELITKKIFYTAITRAKKKLKIFWQPEVCNQVLSRIEEETNNKGKDITIIEQLLKTELQSIK